MKKRILILCILFQFFGLLIYSQNYSRSIGVDSSQWNYQTDLATTDFGFVTEIYLAKGDTVINTNTYKKLYRYCGHEDDEYTLYGCIREDTVIGKAWFLSEGQPQEIEYYDLSLSANDTFFIEHPDNNEFLIVLSVSEESGSKVITFDDDRKFIEGTGSTKSFSELKSPIVTTNLLCSYIDGEQIYDNPMVEACYGDWRVGIKETRSDNFKMYPNPSGDKLIIENNNQSEYINDLKIYDSKGALIKHVIDSGFKIELDISDIQEGNYLLKINESTTKKIIISTN